MAVEARPAGMPRLRRCAQYPLPAGLHHRASRARKTSPSAQYTAPRPGPAFPVHPENAKTPSPRPRPPGPPPASTSRRRTRAGPRGLGARPLRRGRRIPPMMTAAHSGGRRRCLCFQPPHYPKFRSDRQGVRLFGIFSRGSGNQLGRSAPACADMNDQVQGGRPERRRRVRRAAPAPKHPSRTKRPPRRSLGAALGLGGSPVRSAPPPPPRRRRPTAPGPHWRRRSPRPDRRRRRTAPAGRSSSEARPFLPPPYIRHWSKFCK